MLPLLACAEPPAPAPLAITAGPWTLTGRATPDGLALPPLDAKPPECPWCFVERWSNGVATVELIRGPDAVTVDDKPAPHRWAQLSPALRVCLGDPFALPPAGDPRGSRTFDGTSWILALSGDNACHLGGSLVLDARRDSADWRGLTVDGLVWTEGRPKLDAYAVPLAEAIVR